MPSGKQIKLTAFEWKVLKATCQIPLGETRSYTWVAQKIGNPKAVRAVGRALGKNPFLILVPCHRVVNEDGSLGGYAKGKKMKEGLLRLEREIAGCLKSVKNVRF